MISKSVEVSENQVGLITLIYSATPCTYGMYLPLFYAVGTSGSVFRHGQDGLFYPASGGVICRRNGLTSVKY